MEYYAFVGADKVGEIAIDDNNDIYLKFAEMTNNRFLKMDSSRFKDDRKRLAEYALLKNILSRTSGEKRTEYIKNEINKMGFKFIGKR